MKRLLGSYASPYVRRIRLLLHGKDYEFITVDVFSEDGQSMIAKYTQTGRVPIFIDGDKVIWDSRLITRHLLGKELSIDLEKDLVLINEANDAAIALYQLRKFDIDSHWHSQLAQNHIRRIHEVLGHFSLAESKEECSQWDLRSSWLYCLLDWLAFREVINWTDTHPNLKDFMKRFADREDVRATDPRLAR